MGIFGCNARRGKPCAAVGLDQEVDAVRAAAMPAFDQHRAGAEREQLLRLRPHRVFVARQRRVEQGRGFEQIGRDHVGARQQRPQRIHRVGAQQIGAGRGDHDRIEHHVARAMAVETCGDGGGGRGIAQHADLHRADVEIGKHRVDLRGDEVGRHLVDGGNAFGVLRRQRGDHRSAIDAERGEGFEVGLDAGAAARVRARDGEGDGSTHCHACNIFIRFRYASRMQATSLLHERRCASQTFSSAASALRLSASRRPRVVE